MEADMAKTHYACMYDWESDGPSWFVKGTKQECEKAVNKMAKLLDVEPTSEAEIEEDPSEANNRPYVTSKKVDRSCVSTVEKAFGDTYGVGACIMVGYPDTPKEDNCFFQPCRDDPKKGTEFKVGDTVILACFHACVPGGWTVVNQAMTHLEYWQEGYISATNPEEE